MIANSPRLMLENIKHMPMVKYNGSHQTIVTDNLFLKVKIFFLHLNEGMTLLLSTGVYKKNVLDIMLYDKREPVEHFFLSVGVQKSTIESSSTLVNGITLSSNFWSLCKPQGVKSVCHFKGADEIFFTLYFTRENLESLVENCDEKTQSFFKKFLASNTTFMMWPRSEKPQQEAYHLFEDTLLHDQPIENRDVSEYKKLVEVMMHEFGADITKETLEPDHFSMSNEHRLKMLKAKNFLVQFFDKDFPGIETMAQYIGVSPTGLKTGFNQLFGCSPYRYYRREKMKIAKSILEQEHIKVKDLALQMGYENAAKFSAAFKKELGVLPSELTA